MSSENVISISSYQSRLARKRARVQRAKGQLNDDQIDAINALIRKILKSKETSSICEAFAIAKERLGFD